MSLFADGHRMVERALEAQREKEKKENDNKRGGGGGGSDKSAPSASERNSKSHTGGSRRGH